MILKRLLIAISFVVFLFPMTYEAFGQELPDNVSLDTVSVDSNQKNFITWFKNNDGLTEIYYIYRQVWNGTYFIWEEPPLGQTTDTIFTDNISNPCESPISYTVQAAYPNPNNPSEFITSDFGDSIVKNIYLFPPELDKCRNEVNLRWTAYLNMKPSLGEYQILASEAGENGTFELIGSATDTIFTHQDLTSGTEYTYLIQAVNSDGTKSSSSCKKSITSYAPLQPDWVYLRYATVENNEHVKLEWTVGNEAPISKFKILRSTDGLTFDTIGENIQTGDFKPSTAFIDTSADFNTQSYFYKIRVCDSCSIDRLASVNIARTIHLSGIPGITGNTNDLSWNHYENWDFGNSGIAYYHLHRRVNGTANEDGIGNPLLPSETNYLDNVTAFSTSEGVFNYYIVAYENDGDNGFENFKDSSISNEIEIKQETRAILPNAFTPGRPPNENFKPILAFIDLDGYSLAIFNKWGQLIFITEDPSDDGWDGRFKGEYVPADSYVYQLKYRTPQGQNLEKMGTVTVLR